MFSKALMTAVLLTGFAFANPASAHGPGGYSGGYGMMGPGQGMAPGYGMGPGYEMGPGYGMRQGYGMGSGYGMMRPGYGMGPNMMGPGFGGWGPVKANLTVDDVRTNFQRWLAWQGNPRLKVGSVEDDGKDTIVAEILTKDGSLVDRYRVNRSTGAIWRTE